MTKTQSQAQIDGSSTWTISGPLTDHHVKKKKMPREGARVEKYHLV